MLLLVGIGPAAAHTEVLRSSPAPAEQVSGRVDAVELTFLDPVQAGAEIVVLDDAGEPVEGLGTAELSADRTTARVRFAPLEAAGDYIVEYAFAAEDGDGQRQTYRFTYQPAAESPPEEPEDGDSVDLMRLVVVALVLAALAGVAAVASRRRRD